MPSASLPDPAAPADGAFAEFDALFRHVPFGAGLIDSELRYARVNALLASYNGLSVEEHIGRTVREVVPEFADAVEPVLRSILKTGQPGPVIDARLPIPSLGEMRAVRVRFFPVEQAGVVTHVGAIFADIEDQVRAEETLQASESRFRTVFESAPNGIVMTDAQGVITLVNPEAARSFGVSREDLLGRPLADLVPGILDRMQSAGSDAGRSARGHDSEARRPDGSTFPAEVALTPLEGGKMLATVVDITERKQAEEALREREAEARRLALVAARTTNGVVITDDHGRTLWINEGFTRLTGFDLEDLAGRRPGDVMQTPGTDPGTVEYIRECVTTRVPFVAEVLNRRRSGDLFWVRVDATPLFSDDGTFSGYITIQTDVTERRAAEDALRESAERFRMALEGGRMGTFDWDLVTDALAVDEREAALVGLPASELRTGADFFRHVHAEDLEDLRGAVARAMEGRGDYAAEFRYIRPDGEVRWLAGRGHVVREDGAPVRMMGLNYDVTERRRAEEELQKRTREMEQFTYTVSHDLKSPLVTITGFLGLLESHLEAGRPDRARSAAERIRRAAGRMSELIDDLLELSRVGRLRGEVTEVDVNALVAEVADGLSRRMAAARCRLRVRPNMPRVRADARRLAEAFENLLINALKYACPAGATFVDVHGEVLEDEVRYVVEDDGPGIPEEYHETVFELFQRLGGPEVEGTGMGLAIVSRIMEVHGGRAWVESGPGEGARFYLSFPRNALVTPETPAPPADDDGL